MPYQKLSVAEKLSVSLTLNPKEMLIYASTMSEQEIACFFKITIALWIHGSLHVEELERLGLRLSARSRPEQTNVMWALERMLKPNAVGRMHLPHLTTQRDEAVEKIEKRSEKAANAARIRHQRERLRREGEAKTENASAPSSPQAARGKLLKALTTNTSPPSGVIAASAMPPESDPTLVDLILQRGKAGAPSTPEAAIEPGAAPSDPARPEGFALVPAPDHAKPKSASAPTARRKAADGGNGSYEPHEGAVGALPQTLRVAAKRKGTPRNKPSADPRYKVFKDMIKETYSIMNQVTMQAVPWTIREEQSLAAMMKAEPLLDRDGLYVRLQHRYSAWCECIKQKIKRGAINAREPLCSVIKRLIEFAAGPINSFGDPIVEGAAGWR